MATDWFTGFGLHPDWRLRLLRLLAELEDPSAPVDRREVLESGDDLADLAIEEGVTTTPGHERGGPEHVAWLLGDLRTAQLITWEWQQWPTDSEPESFWLFHESHLPRMRNVRLTRKAADLVARRRVKSDTETRDTSEAKQSDAGSPIENPRDVFISHASDDKDAIVRPLANALRARGLTVWFDEYELVVGDSLTERIDQGLASSRFGVVVISHAFLAKPWPKRELRGLVAREMARGTRIILPVWHGVDYADVAAASPPLADVLAAKSSDGADAVAERIAEAITRRRPSPPTETGRNA